MITGTIEHKIDRFGSALVRYFESGTKDLDTVLEERGHDLGVKLFQGFKDRKWGGPGKSPRIATAELEARTSAGEGTKVRSSLLARYRRERASMNFFARSIGQQKRRFGGTLDQHTRLIEQRDQNRRQRAALWRSIVGKEVGLRQSGIGVLAASFLWYRRRSSQAKGQYLVKNRTGKPLGSVVKEPGMLRILGFTDGLSETGERYGVFGRALEGATARMEASITRRREAAALRYLQAFGRVAA